MSESGRRAFDTVYPDNELDGFRMGALFDLRVRIGLEALQHCDFSAAMGAADPDAAGRNMARCAYAAACELIAIAERDGLVKAFPENEMSKAMKGHAKRVVRWQFTQQAEGQAQQREFGGMIMAPNGGGPGILPPNGRQ